MQVIKRNGIRQDVSFDKVATRIKSLAGVAPALVGVNCHLVARKIISRINNGISTSELDTIGAAIVQPMLLEHPHYGDLASRLLVSNHHKNCNQRLMEHFAHIPGLTEEVLENDLFYWTCRALWENIDMNGNHSPMIAPHLMRFVEEHGEKLESLLKYNKDYQFTYPGFELAYGSYLLQCSMRTKGEYQTITLDDGGCDLRRYPIERPQHMWLRVALGIWLTYPKVPYRDQYNNANSKSGFWESLLETSSVEFDSVSFKHIEDTYNLLSNMDAMHATPTLFHSGMLTPQLSSCFLTTIKDDSLESIADFYKSIMMTSKWAGGIGSHIHHIRPEGSYIGGTGGTSNGLIPLLKCANEIAKYVDQGGSKRPGSHAVYLEMWHGDIEAFIDMRRSRGNLAKKAPALFNALWVCDEFMRAVEEEERRIKLGEKDVRLWYLMDPNRCPGLPDKFDAELRIGWIEDAELNAGRFAFTTLYRSYIKAGKFMRRISASALWKQVCEVTEETSIPYLLFKDAANRKTNQSNLGTIRSSNLCIEIMEYSDGNETAVCNLASICLNKYVVYEKPVDANLYPFVDGFALNIDLTLEETTRLGLPMRGWFDFTRLRETVKKLVINLDQVIDQNYYPTVEEHRSNMRHRPMGLGVQGLADCYAALWLPFDSELAMQLDFYIFEHIDFASKLASIELAKTKGVYSTFAGSPASFGKFQVDLWLDEYNSSDQKTKVPEWDPLPYDLSCDWEQLSCDVKLSGLRNSLTLAPMPTASTSTLTGFSPAFEPFNAILYKHTDKYGEAFICNRQLQDALIARGLWTKDVRDALMRSRTGSVQDITTIPRPIRDIFKNAWDMSVKVLINHVLRRGVFVDQSQSFNWFVEAPTAQIITQGSFYGWKRGIKSGRYYLRRLPPVDAKKIQLTAVGPIVEPKDEEPDGEICTMKDGCIVCGS